jgi:predicted metalloendopeptidase
MVLRGLAAGCTLLALALCAAAADSQKSGLNHAAIDISVSPRQDLFRHANGRWLADTPIPADRASYGIDAITQDRTEVQLRTLVGELLSRQDLAPDSNAAKIAVLYRDFMDEPRCNRLGLAPLKPMLDQVAALRSRTELPALFARLSLLGVDMPMDVGVTQDERQADRYLVHLGQSVLSLPDRDYYLDQHEARFRSIRKAFLRYATAQFRRLQDPAPERAAHDVLQFEQRLAAAQWTRVENRDPLKTYNPRSIEQLRHDSPQLDWAVWFTALGLPADPGTVIVGQPDYQRKLDHILASTPLHVLKTWLRWQVLRAYAPLLDEDTARRQFAFESGVLSGIPEQRPRWKRGLAVVEGAIGEGLGQLYVERHFPPESKARIQDLVSHLIAAYASSIDQLDWLGPQTREAAHAKLAQIHSKLGYPEHWRDYGGLQFTPGDLVGNVQRAQLFEARRHLDRLGKPVDRDEWAMTPQTVNAYYEPTLNEIVFPAAQLQAPYFDAAAEDAANYGDIGFIIGHELSHAFDDEGSQFDGQGNLRDWWTAEDHEHFRQRTAALVEQYSAVTPVRGVHVNGELTLGENIADNAGLTIAWKAYVASLQGREAPVIDGLTAPQRFYISYAQSWLGKQREADLVRQIKTDPHAPLDVRTNLAIRNQDAFHAAFGTEPGDPLWLAPAQRVRLW